MARWIVTLHFACAEPPALRMDELFERLVPLASVAMLKPDAVSVSVTTNARLPEGALHSVKPRVHLGLQAAGFRKLILTAVQVHTATEEHVEADRVYPPLVGVAEIASSLGVSKQRASKLAASADFPSPVADLNAGPVWFKADVEAFRATWERKRGRRKGAER